jgi:hypothetical protein
MVNFERNSETYNYVLLIPSLQEPCFYQANRSPVVQNNKIIDLEIPVITTIGRDRDIEPAK